MLDRNLVANNAEVVREMLQRRGASETVLSELDTLAAVIDRRRQLQTETDGLRAQRKRLSKEIGPLMRAGDTAAAEPLKQQVAEFANRLQLLEEERKNLAAQEDTLLHTFPNLIDSRTPDGSDESSNEVISSWGTPPSLDFQPLEHHVLAEKLGMYDSTRASKIAGTRFAVLTGDIARMERALISFCLDIARQNGYIETMVPYIVNRSSMTGTGQLPKFEEDLFKLTAEVGGEDAFLIPTAEVPVTNLYRDEIIPEASLPLYHAAFTPCFRAEAGSYGKDTHGLIRQHQFHKVELVKICLPENSDEEHEKLTQNACQLLELLKLPYRKVRLCAGDIGFSAYMCYDLEVWLPGQNQYREISSCSNFNDFQARRMRLRYRPAEGGKPKICHTINGSGLAIGRTLVAIIENYQQADGSIVVPEVLRPYMGGQEKITA